MPVIVNRIGRNQRAVRRALIGAQRIGTIAKGISAPTKIIRPPMTSTTMVAQPSRKGAGSPIACKTPMKSSGPRASFGPDSIRHQLLGSTKPGEVFERVLSALRQADAKLLDSPESHQSSDSRRPA
jgi:hypothetical protein